MKHLRILGIKRIIALVLFTAACAYAAVQENLKYEVSQQRIVVTCLDHKAPTVHVLNPASGPYVIVDCEREK